MCIVLEDKHMFFNSAIGLPLTVCCLHGSWVASDCWLPPSYPDNTAHVPTSSSWPPPLVHSIGEHILLPSTSNSAELTGPQYVGFSSIQLSPFQNTDIPEGVGKDCMKLWSAQTFPTPATITATTVQDLSFSLAPCARLLHSESFLLEVLWTLLPILSCRRMCVCQNSKMNQVQILSQKISGLKANHRIWLEIFFSVLKCPMADKWLEMGGS